MACTRTFWEPIFNPNQKLAIYKASLIDNPGAPELSPVLHRDGVVSVERITFAFVTVVNISYFIF